MRNSLHHYSVGALLYCPANLETIVPSLLAVKFPRPFSLALCLEDTIHDDHVDEAVATLLKSLDQLYHASKTFYLPHIFIRVRNPLQIPQLWKALGKTNVLVYGFISPKFTPDNADEYISAIRQVNTIASRPVYFMPILESATMIDPLHRSSYLHLIKDKLDTLGDLVSNVRLGGNDLCHAFSLRRGCDESIHQIAVISQLFSDIMAIFGRDYVISGPVWEYFDGEGWDTGLIQELADDRRNGFVGKTVIHPNQIPLVNRAYQVSQTDYDDACAILNWNPTATTLVSGSANHQRMNERKTHTNWAEKTLLLAQIYGVYQQDKEIL